MEFDPIDHLICTMANRRKTTLQEIVNVTKENVDVLNNLISYGVSKNILSKTRREAVSNSVCFSVKYL